MQEASTEKTAFSPGPRYGLWEFVVMPYGLTGATHTCQCGLDESFHECHDCVDNYVDDIIIFFRWHGFPQNWFEASVCGNCKQQVSPWKDPNAFWVGVQSLTMVSNIPHKVSPHPQIGLKSLQSGQLLPTLRNWGPSYGLPTSTGILSQGLPTPLLLLMI